MTEIALYHAPIPEKLRYAEQLAQADMLPANYRRKPGNVLLAVEYGEMLGLHPLTAIQQVHVIEGKLSMSAELMRAQCIRAGHRFRVIETTPKIARVGIERGDDPGHWTEMAFTIDDAQQAGLTGKGNWSKFPTAMLLARATSAIVRAVCPEVLMGISYVPEELGAAIDEDGAPVVIDAPSTEQIDTADDDTIAALRVEIGERLDDEQRAGLAAWWKAEQIWPMDSGRLTYEDVDRISARIVEIAEGSPDGPAASPAGDPDNTGDATTGDLVGDGGDASTGTPVSESPPDPANEPTISQAQNRKLHAALRTGGIVGPARHTWASDVLGRPVDTFTGLPAADARTLIDAAEQLEPQAELALGGDAA